jgi:tetratricopeptide (TPR) repeat protein
MSSLHPGDTELRDAMRLASARLDEAEARSEPFEMVHALTQVARCYRGLQMLPSAEACLLQALCWSRLTGSIDGIVDLVCELSETTVALAAQAQPTDPARARAARERARDHAFEASTLAGRVADSSWEVQVLLRISDVLDRCGDRDDAVQLQTRALRLMSGVTASEIGDPALLPGLGRLADS